MYQHLCMCTTEKKLHSALYRLLNFAEVTNIMYDTCGLVTHRTVFTNCGSRSVIVNFRFLVADIYQKTSGKSLDL